METSSYYIPIIEIPISQNLSCFCNHCPYTYINPEVGQDLCLQSTYRKPLTYKHETFRRAAPTEKHNVKQKILKSETTPFFESLWDISNMSVDLHQLSLRYWTPAMNPFTLSSKLSSVIIALFQHSGSDKGGEFCLPAGEPLWVSFTEGMKYDPGSPVLCTPDFMKSGLMMTRQCTAMCALVREYFTTLESYHWCCKFLLYLNAG